MALQIELLETSFQEIAPEGAAFVATFYDKPFAEFPQTKAFFTTTDIKEQQKKLLGALALPTGCATRLQQESDNK